MRQVAVSCELAHRCVGETRPSTARMKRSTATCCPTTCVALYCLWCRGASYGTSRARRKQMKKSHAAADEADDDDIDSDDEDDEEGGMLLSDLLTQNLAKEARRGSQKPSSSAAAAAASLAAAAATSARQDGASSDSDVGNGLGLSSSDEEDDGGDDQGNHMQLMSMVEGMGAGSASKARTKKKARVEEASEPLAEAEYNLAPERSGLGGLTLESLVGSLRNTTKFGTLKKQLGVLDKGAVRLLSTTQEVDVLICFCWSELAW